MPVARHRGALVALTLLLASCSTKSHAVQPREHQVELGPSAAPESAPSASDESAQANLACLRATSTSSTAKLASAELDEVSGIAASRVQPGVFWVHNDSGDSARVFAINLEGKVLLELVLSGATARDFEDIALLPLARADGGSVDVLYVADTGDNWHARSSVQIYRIEAPHVPSGPRAKVLRKANKIEVTYEDGGHDVESLFADVRTGDLYLVAKGSLFSRSQPVGVYRLPASELRRGQVQAKRVANVAMGPTTSADMLADGSGIAIRNYSRASFLAALRRREHRDGAEPQGLRAAARRWRRAGRVVRVHE